MVFPTTGSCPTALFHVEGRVDCREARGFGLVDGRCTLFLFNSLFGVEPIWYKLLKR